MIHRSLLVGSRDEPPSDRRLGGGPRPGRGDSGSLSGSVRRSSSRIMIAVGPPAGTPTRKEGPIDPRP
eukprot:2732839-Rhodomonas_salina.2